MRERERVRASYTRNIQGREVELNLVEVDPKEVVLDARNPRLRFSLQQLPELERSDAACALLLTSQEETEALKRSIWQSGGVQEPIYLRAAGTVAEGNRRVVATRCLQEEHPDNPAFATIPAWVIPAATPEGVVQDLLNEIHLGSVRGWAPYEKGAQMRALVGEGGLIEEEVAERYRMTPKEVRQHIAAVDYMDELYFPITNDPSDPAHRAKFSYFLEFTKSGRLNKHCEEEPGLPNEFARWVRDGKIDKGVQVRRLARILESKAASRLLNVAGFGAAIEHLKREDPKEQELYALVDQLRMRLDALTMRELVELRDCDARRQLLLDLRDELNATLELARGFGGA